MNMGAVTREAGQYATRRAVLFRSQNHLLDQPRQEDPAFRDFHKLVHLETTILLKLERSLILSKFPLDHIQDLSRSLVDDDRRRLGFGESRQGRQGRNKDCQTGWSG